MLVVQGSARRADGRGRVRAVLAPGAWLPRLRLIRGADIVHIWMPCFPGVLAHLCRLLRRPYSLYFVSGAYFTKIDGDDFAFPDRLARQARYLDTHPEVDLVGSGMIHFADGGRTIGKAPMKARHEEICRHPRRGFLLYHPTWMGRIEWFRRHRYDPGRGRGQDFDLLLRTYRHRRFASLEEPLLGHRTNNTALGLRLRSRRNACVALARNAWTQRDPALV